MTPFQIKEIKDKEVIVLSNIEDAIENGDLYSVSMVLPELKEKIISNLRVGLFSRKLKYGNNNKLLKESEKYLSKIITKPNWKSVDINNDYNPLLKISVKEVLTLEKELNNNGLNYVFFTEKVKEIIHDNEIGLEFSYEDLDCNVFIEKSSQEKIDLESLLNIYEVHIMVPDVELLFNLDDLSEVPEWQWEYITAYEEWSWKINENNSYIQIGGYGSWVQGSYTNNYISQVNNDVGDAGSVFTVVNNKKIESWVDMS